MDVFIQRKKKQALQPKLQEVLPQLYFYSLSSISLYVATTQTICYKSKKQSRFQLRGGKKETHHSFFVRAMALGLAACLAGFLYAQTAQLANEPYSSTKRTVRPPHHRLATTATALPPPNSLPWRNGRDQTAHALERKERKSLLPTGCEHFRSGVGWGGLGERLGKVVTSAMRE